MSQTAPTPPPDLAGRRQLAPNETFCFGCHSDLPCFTRCCADINILLTPVDVLRLSRRLGLTTTEFLDQHALLPITKDLKLPTVLLKMSDSEDKRCSFVTEKGCGVYEDRPWSCRMYPVAMAVPPARVGVEPKPVYFLMEDDFCEGHEEPGEWTVDQWREDQDVMAREELEAGFREIVSHPWFIGGNRQLDPKRLDMFFTACYDLDRFRRFVFESTFLERFELDPDLVERMREDDDELLRFAFRWLKLALFGEPVLPVKGSSSAENQPRRTA
jgi:Fe-S-cluster containining protein